MFERDHSPRKPVVTSLTSANAEFQRWLAQNSREDFRDALGHIWLVEAQHQVFPDPVNRHASRFRLNFDIKTSIDRQILTKLGVLDTSIDQRLISLMDDSTITFIYQRPAFESDKMEIIRRQALEDYAKIRERLSTLNLTAYYRRVASLLVDRRFAMTYPRARPQQIKIDLEV